MSGLPFFHISGANGFIGSHFVDMIEKNGYSWSSVKDKKGQLWRFSNQPYLELKANHRNILIHCAWLMDADSFQQNQLITKSSIELFDLADQLDIEIVFISSMSAFIGCQSMYGQAKLELENYLLLKDYKSYIIRPGLVWEQGAKLNGILGTLEKFVSKFIVIPFVEHGSGRFYFTEVGDLTQIVLSIIKKEVTWSNKHPVLAHPTPFTLHSILYHLSIRQNKKIIQVKIPILLLKFSIKFLLFIGLRIVRYDSFVSLISLDSDPHFSETVKNLKSFF